MKLYTKEMFLIAAEKCEVSMIDANHIIKYIDEYVTPIELPTDEKPMKYHCVPKEISDDDIFKQSVKAMEEMYGSGSLTEIDAHFRGAKWMQKQLKGGDNE